MFLPADSHVHTEYSWDAPNGDMVASCARAAELGLPAIAFTEHVDHTAWRVTREELGTGHHVPLLRWWRDEGGDAVTFGSDAHDPSALARGFRDAVHLAQAHGFRPGRRLYDVWGRS